MGATFYNSQISVKGTRYETDTRCKMRHIQWWHLVCKQSFIRSRHQMCIDLKRISHGPVAI